MSMFDILGDKFNLNYDNFEMENNDYYYNEVVDDDYLNQLNDQNQRQQLNQFQQTQVSNSNQTNQNYYPTPQTATTATTSQMIPEQYQYSTPQYSTNNFNPPTNNNYYNYNYDEYNMVNNEELQVNNYFEDKNFTQYYLQSANVDLSNYSTPNITPHYSPSFDDDQRRPSTNSFQSLPVQNMSSSSIPLTNSMVSGMNHPLSINNSMNSLPVQHNMMNNSMTNMSPISNIHPSGSISAPLSHSTSLNAMNDLPPSIINNSPPPTSPVSRKKDDNKIITSNKSNFRIVRGVAAGGSSARPPKESATSKSTYIPIKLNISGGTLEDIVKPTWSKSESEDQRRIVRIERFQKNEQIFINFSIIGSANENPTPLPPMANSNIDIIEVSCLQCSKKLSEEIDLPSPINEEHDSDQDDFQDGKKYDFDYYITSVEVIEIVELLIGTYSEEPSERRKERGRVRSNLVPFWSKKPISSRLDNNLINQPDFKIELAKRIMSYEIRKPRGFDKEVRILKWEKLLPALKRALQSYYCEIPPTV
ncbi:hypothetical protein CLIB1444_05S07008 [[Candida] jaroonii]|uniref:Uncharacterized protein n=1 Tax=[Candida] jaroonii TaxID=467808 RepID=A0ACA9Y927_9ASCO|nr:hypothetical protein CLIB1444_05S07008 [[Candida] jaroonii]